MNGITRISTTVLVSAGLGLAGIGIGPGTAMARRGAQGRPVPAVAPWPDFDWSVCHHYKGTAQGTSTLIPESHVAPD